jgi:tetratricopeptide (TPR) repeat protein
MMKKLCFILTLALPLSANAQDLDRAIEDFNNQSYQEAIAGFYEVLKYGENRGDRNDARYYMARAMLNENLNFSALSFLREIILDGPRNRHYVSAIGYLLEAGNRLRDDFNVPNIINREYGDAFRDLKDVVLDRVNYLIAQVLYRQDKLDDALGFLDPEAGVPPGSSEAPSARYLSGLIAIRNNDLESALARFQDALKEASKARKAGRTEYSDRVYRQSVLGIARVYYEMGSRLGPESPEGAKALQQAALHFRMVPRFTSDWGDAIFERGWVHFQLSEYGKSLGAVHSLSAPFFAENAQHAESYVLKMTNYFYNCQWDRVRRTLGEFQSAYGASIPKLKAFLASKPQEAGDIWWYEQLLESVKGSAEDAVIPQVIARTVASNNRYDRLRFFLDMLGREADALRSVDLFKGELAGELLTAMDEARGALEPFMGRLVRDKLRRQLVILDGMGSQADIIEIQTGLEEAEWLDQQREIEFAKRKRLPRPFVPSEKFQYWPFHGEYWIDELGFYEYAIKSECVE